MKQRSLKLDTFFTIIFSYYVFLLLDRLAFPIVLVSNDRYMEQLFYRHFDRVHFSCWSASVGSDVMLHLSFLMTLSDHDRIARSDLFMLCTCTTVQCFTRSFWNQYVGVRKVVFFQNIFFSYKNVVLKE